MRLWHHELIPYLPRQQLLGQHRECCALRGKGWGKKHSTVNYVFQNSWEHLFNFHFTIMDEMKSRNYNPNPVWRDFYYRGKRSQPQDPDWTSQTGRKTFYPEHTPEYLQSCIRNLTQKIKSAPSGKYNENEIYRLYSWLEEHGYEY